LWVLAVKNPFDLQQPKTLRGNISKSPGTFSSLIGLIAYPVPGFNTDDLFGFLQDIA
jgi:hypothetical protein